MAIEDQRFYEHGGVDDEAIVRAALKDLEAGEAVEGGSTITQQLVRNLCIPDPDDNLERKIIEAQLADEYSEAPLEGRNPRPVPEHRLLRDGRRQHRGRRPGRLADLLLEAGLEAEPDPGGAARRPAAGADRLQPDPQPGRRPRAPRRGAREDGRPRLHLRAPKRARRRAAASGSTSPTGFFKHRQPYFFDYVEDKLIEAYGVNTVRQGGLDVYTTIDPKLQEVGLEAMRSALPY